MYKLVLNHHFDSCHNLVNGYVGACSKLHGHRWDVIFRIETTCLKALGGDMLVDFKVLKGMINETFDHDYLNEKVSFNPTAENLAKYIHEFTVNKMKEIGYLDEEFKVEIELFESPEASIIYK